MSLFVSPDLEGRLRERAQGAGMTIDAYLERLIEDEDAQVRHTEALLQEAADSGAPIDLTREEWDRMEAEAFAEVEARRKRA